MWNHGRVWSASILASLICFAQSPVDRTKQALQMVLAHKYEGFYALFSPEMKKAVSLEQYSAQAGKVLDLGALQSQDPPNVNTVGAVNVVTIPLHFEKGSIDFIVSWNSAGQVQGTFFRPAAPPWDPPSYSNAASFAAREVTVVDGDWKLPGTLTVPKGKAPFPGLVLVHGTGPNDRDESVGATKVFRDFAEGLSSRGIAVLRYEKRTRQYGARMSRMAKLTTREEVVDDAVKAAELLRTQPDVDPKRVFLLGHSLGGNLAPRIATEDGKLAGLIIAAGSVRPLEDVIVDEYAYLGASPKDLVGVRAQAAKIKALEPGDEDAPAIFRLPVSYWLDLKSYDPTAVAQKLTIPMLILQGERDYQATMKDFALWKAALGQRKDVTFHSYPALNHLFIAGEGKSLPAEYQKPGHVAPEVIQDVANWILRPQ